MGIARAPDCGDTGPVIAGRPALFALSWGSAAVCLAAGLSYLDPARPPDGRSLAVLAAVGALWLAGAGSWQWAARDRRLPLAVLAALASGFAVANSTGLFLGMARGHLPGVPYALHLVGLALGLALTALSLGGIVGDERGRRSTTGLG
ncbi:MAG: hypothetical protein HY775_03480 [Acidobacteria bacterium]|nr:hypothetical protein [Acidobacteriota bacterium]